MFISFQYDSDKHASNDFKAPIWGPRLVQYENERPLTWVFCQGYEQADTVKCLSHPYKQVQWEETPLKNSYILCDGIKGLESRF